MAETKYTAEGPTGTRITVFIDDTRVARGDVDWLLQYFRAETKRGVVFSDGETIQIGWSINMVKARSAGEVGVFEPDFASTPIVFKDSVTTTLQHLRLQRDAAASAGVEPDFPSLRQSAITCTAIAEGEEVLLFARDEGVGSNDSGVFVGCTLASHDHDVVENLERSSLYATVLKFPAVLPWISMPAGTKVRLGGRPPQIFVNERRVEPKKRSILSRLFSR